MKVLELFAGTRSIGNAFERRGHEVFSVEWDKQFDKIDLYADILNVQAEDIISKFGRPDVIWASPDCTSYSIAAISHHRVKDEHGNLVPVSPYAKYCDRVNQHMLCLILALSPRFWFIENPRGGLRKMDFMSGLPRYTITYCQYGDKRMKPTDIFTNHPDPKFKPMCHNGDSCHEPAPRGARTGTQGINGSVERARIPKQLCEHIVDICEEHGICRTGAAADVAEVRHGRWESSRPDAPMFGFHFCSLCGRRRTSPQDNYCPNCGAKMYVPDTDVGEMDGDGDV